MNKYRFSLEFFSKGLTKIYSLFISYRINKVGRGFTVFPYIDLIGGRFIYFGEGCGIGKRTILSAWSEYRGQKFFPKITIGNNVWIGEDCHITAINNISIGNGVLLGKKITITDNSHGNFDLKALVKAPADRELVSKGAVNIEDNVWIGDKATILPNVTIGSNSIIGANSVVTKNIPKNSIAVGNPAKVIKSL